MFKVKGNRLRFLGHQGPLPLMSPGGLDPSGAIMSTKDTITSTRGYFHFCPKGLFRQLFNLVLRNSDFLEIFEAGMQIKIPYRNFLPLPDSAGTYLQLPLR